MSVCGEDRGIEGVEPPPCVLAIDPGSAKCGVAVVRQDGVVLYRAIVAPDQLVNVIQTAIHECAPQRVLIGGGTGSKPVLRAIEQAVLSLPICLVNESHTSEEARKRYVAETPPRRWQRLLPRCLRVPDAPYDDLVAILLAERWFRNRGS